MVEESFPHRRALDEPGGEDEERRIFYVAITRAMNELTLTYPLTIARGGRGPTVFTMPSRFLTEIDDSLVERAEIEARDRSSMIHGRACRAPGRGRSDDGGPGSRNDRRRRIAHHDWIDRKFACWSSPALGLVPTAVAQRPRPSTNRPATRPRVFRIQVVEEGTGRGVPLVELKTVNQIRYVTDSNGIVAFDEPGLFNRKVFFTITQPRL